MHDPNNKDCRSYDWIEYQKGPERGWVKLDDEGMLIDGPRDEPPECTCPAPDSEPKHPCDETEWVKNGVVLSPEQMEKIEQRINDQEWPHNFLAPECRALLAHCKALETRCEHLLQQAKIHAQEARTANASLSECYQVATGSTGEPGNWNGAEPIRSLKAELDAANHQLLSCYLRIEELEADHRAEVIRAESIKEQRDQLRAAIEEAGRRLTEHGTPYYAYGDSEGGCALANVMQEVANSLSKALAPSDGLSMDSAGADES